MTIGNRNRAWKGGGGSARGQIRWLDLPAGAMAKTGLVLDPYSAEYSLDGSQTVRVSAEFALTADNSERSVNWNFLFGHESYDDFDGWKFRLYAQYWPPYFQTTYNYYGLDRLTRYVLTGYIEPHGSQWQFDFENEQGYGDQGYASPTGNVEPGTTFCIGGADTVLNDFGSFGDRTWPGLIGRTTLWYDDGGDAIADFVPWKLPDGTCGFMDVAGDQGFLSSATETPFQEGFL